jgi:hypothetical protein
MATPAFEPHRMPWRLRYAAIRFAIRPSADNAERFDRFALLDLDSTRGIEQPGAFCDELEPIGRTR